MENWGQFVFYNNKLSNCPLSHVDWARENFCSHCKIYFHAVEVRTEIRRRIRREWNTQLDSSPNSPLEPYSASPPKQKHLRAKSLQLRRPREFDLPGWLLKIETTHIYSRFLGITNTINGSVRFHLCFAICSFWWSLSWKTSRNKLLVRSVWIFTPNPRP